MTNDNKLSREEQIKAIYEKIADKTLSEGCLYLYENKTHTVRFQETLEHNFLLEIKQGRIKIIGHPVMIGDVLDYCSKNNLNLKLNKWLNFIEPIEKQDDLCIDYIYNLIK